MIPVKLYEPVNGEEERRKQIFLKSLSYDLLRETKTQISKRKVLGKHPQSNFLKSKILEMAHICGIEKDTFFFRVPENHVIGLRRGDLWIIASKTTKGVHARYRLDNDSNFDLALKIFEIFVRYGKEGFEPAKSLVHQDQVA